MQTLIATAGPNYQLGLSVDLAALNGGTDVIQVAANTVGPVPEPMTMLLFGTGLAGVAAKLRRRRKV